MTAPAGAYDADVIILALDRAEETEQAIASALAQTGCSFHLHVLDQGSRPEALRRIAAAVRERDNASLIALGRNLGVPGGRNHASALGHGRIIVALDNDAAFDDPTTLARAVAALDADPALGAVGFRILVHATGADDLSSWGYPVSLLARAAETFDAATFVGAGHAIRRTAWDAAGGYDDALFFCWEEFDFCLRAIALGWQIRYRGDIVVRHKVSPEARVSWSATRWFYFVRNRLYIGRKTGAGWASLAPRYAGYLLKGLRHGLLGQTMRALPAAMRLAAAAGPPHPLSPVVRAYLRRNDLAHRGSLLTRLRNEVLCRLPQPGRPSRSRSSKGNTAGLSSR
jgi:GT2 family glycosyltransferase